VVSDEELRAVSSEYEEPSADEEGEGMSEEPFDSEAKAAENWDALWGPRRLTVADVMRWSEYDPWKL
jgi:hypothetical protein